ncbi:MAG TPA: hypothetical protein VFG08_04300 [Candidatus Polarisedimenticolia bacterium]|nr:hypothetical protein [Candidatus Polarisedimenticolia bacterium]
MSEERFLNDRRAEWVIALSCTFSFLALVPFLRREALAALFEDDAFYYYQIARNIVAGIGPTFDGIHPTNGFHPLWMFVLLPIFAFLPGDLSPLRAVAGLETALVALALVALFRALRERLTVIEAMLIPMLLLALPGSRGILASGLESALLLWALTLAWRHYLHVAESDPPGARRFLALGGWCAVAFLARPEAGLLVPAVLLLARARFSRRVASFSAFCLPPAITVIAYISWNRLLFGTWLPISGMTKSYHAASASPSIWLKRLIDFPWLGREIILRAKGVPSLLLLPAPDRIAGIILLGLFIGALWRWRKALAASVRHARVALLFVVSGGMVFADLLVAGYLPAWYQAPILLCTACLLGMLGMRSRRLAGGMLLAALCCALARVPATAWMLRDSTRYQAASRIRAAEFIRESTSPSTRIGSWNAGMLGYFSHRSVINLDGLANDMSYYRRVTQGRRLENYLIDERVSYIADQACGATPDPRPYLRRTGEESIAARLTLIAVFQSGDLEDSCPGYAVWSFDGGSGIRGDRIQER